MPRAKAKPSKKASGAVARTRASAPAKTKAKSAKTAAKSEAKKTSARAAGKKTTTARGTRKKTPKALPDEQYLFFFGQGKAEGNGEMKDLLGGKGAGLAQMTNAKLNVPPGFTISTSVCTIFLNPGARLEKKSLKIRSNSVKRKPLAEKHRRLMLSSADKFTFISSR